MHATFFISFMRYPKYFLFLIIILLQMTLFTGSNENFIQNSLKFTIFWIVYCMDGDFI